MATKKVVKQEGGRLPTLVRFSVLDPSPQGHELTAENLDQALRDFAGLSTMAVLEPVGVAMVAGEKCIPLRQYRFALVVTSAATKAIIGHLQAYASTILTGHPVTIEMSTIGMFA